MHKINRLMFQTSFLTLAVIAFLGSVGYFQHVYYQDWYIYFTNHSNYFCFFIMTLEIIETYKKSMRTDHDTVYPRLKYVASVYITITFLIFNFVLRNAPDRNPANNYTVNCVLLHVVLPVMFVADWVKNYQHGYVTIKDILSVSIYPLLYVVFALVRSFFVVVDPTNPYSKKYPYFFVNLDNLGWGGVIKWCILILIAFEAVAVLFFFLDKWLAKRKKFLRAKAKAEKEALKQPEAEAPTTK